MLRSLLLATALLALFSVPLVAEDSGPGPTKVSEQSFDLGSLLSKSFYDIARMPTRLTSYNSHDDAAKATYVCCRPDQEEDIARALKANAAFLTLYPYSDYADDTLMHNARVNSVQRHFRGEIEAYAALVARYPDSDLADDACWGLAMMHSRDKARPEATQALLRLVRNYPNSTWADDAYALLAKEYKDLDNEAGALEALNLLATKYPASDYCPKAIFAVGKKYESMGNYAAAIRTYRELQRRYPYSDMADDAQFAIGNCYRAAEDDVAALEAYEFIIHQLPGSGMTKPAMREANTIYKRLSGRGRRGATADRYNMNMRCPCKIAMDLFDKAAHHQRYRMYKSAVELYTQFINRFPGNDNFDDAIYNIGICYLELNMLFAEINQARGPDDLFRLKVEWEDALGSRAKMPAKGHLSAVEDAAGAFEFVAYRLPGSPWRDDALYQLARSYEDSGRRAEEAMMYQQLLLSFPGSQHEMEALVRLMRYYGDPKNFPGCVKLYGRLAKAYPSVFPLNLADSPSDFKLLMKLYRRHTDFAWEEYNHHHIPYRLTLSDLQQDADFYIAALQMKRGQYRSAIKMLKNLARRPTCDFAASAQFLIARAYEKRGDTKNARTYYNKILQQHPLSGLADDAQMCLGALGNSEDFGPIFERIAAKFGPLPGDMDVWASDELVVVAPWTATAKMRAYNLPNIWRQARADLGAWTGHEPQERQIIYLAESGGRTQAGNPIRLCACQIGDPPRWSLGFRELAENAMLGGGARSIAQFQPAITRGLSDFAAASLQLALVSETRDAVGSAVAVVLPNQEVLDARKRALEALQEYVRNTPDVKKLTPQVVCGMLYSLLDQQGLAKDSLADWQPYAKLFRTWDEAGGAKSPEQSASLFVEGINKAFGTDLTQQMKEWGFPVAATTMTRLPGRS